MPPIYWLQTCSVDIAYMSLDNGQVGLSTSHHQSLSLMLTVDTALRRKYSIPPEVGLHYWYALQTAVSVHNSFLLASIDVRLVESTFDVAGGRSVIKIAVGVIWIEPHPRLCWSWRWLLPSIRTGLEDLLRDSWPSWDYRMLITGRPQFRE